MKLAQRPNCYSDHSRNTITSNGAMGALFGNLHNCYISKFDLSSHLVALGISPGERCDCFLLLLHVVVWTCKRLLKFPFGIEDVVKGVVVIGNRHRVVSIVIL